MKLIRILNIFAILLATIVILCFKIPEAASGEPDMVCYSGLSQEEAEIFAGAFSKLHKGITIEVTRVNTGKLNETLEKEGDKCPASIVFGGSLPAYLVAAEKGLFQTYFSPETKKYDKKFRDPEGRWTGIYIGMIGFAVNEAAGVPTPESWQDLLKPVYKGKVAIADPNYSGTAYITLSTLVQMMGEDKAFEYLKELDVQVALYPRSGAEPAKMAGKGAVGVGIAFAHDILNVRRDYPDLKLSFPSEGTGIEIGGAAITRNAPNPELAREFIDFLASPRAQNLYGSSGVPPRFPTHPDAKNPTATLTRGKMIKIFDFDFSKSAENEPRLIKKWTDRIFSKRKK